MNKKQQKKLLTEIMNDDAKDGLYHIVDTNKMITAVSWLVDWMGKNQYYIDNTLLETVKQAKEMEKEQIEDAFQAGKFNGYEFIKEGKEVKDPLKYYNETYKK